MRRRPTRCGSHDAWSGRMRPGRQRSWLAPTREQRAVARPHAALAPDEAAGRARRPWPARTATARRAARGGRRPRGRCSARCTSLRGWSRHAAGQPSVSSRITERHASTHGSSNVERGTKRYQSPATGVAGLAVLPVVDPASTGRSSKFVPEPEVRLDARARPSRSAVDAALGSGTSGISVTSCSRPRDVADRPDHRVEDRLAALRHRDADRLRALGLAQRRDLDVDAASKSATPRKWPTSVAGRSKRECAPAARSAIAAT